MRFSVRGARGGSSARRQTTDKHGMEESRRLRPNPRCGRQYGARESSGVARLRARVLALALTASLSGCLEFETVIEIRADGTGTQSVTMTMQNELLERLQRQSVALVGAASTGRLDPAKSFEPATLRRQLDGAGMECTKLELEEPRAHRRLTVKASFDSLAKLRKSPLGGGAAEWKFLPAAKPGRWRVILYPRGRAAWLDAKQRVAKLPNPLPEREAAYFAKRRAEMAGLKVRVVLRLPGDVLLHTKNLRKTGPREVTATIRS
mgnify:CR=1 FL=1